MQGVTAEDILGVADWSTELSIQQFCYKPVRKTQHLPNQSLQLHV